MRVKKMTRNTRINTTVWQIQPFGKTSCVEHVALWGERSYKVCETIKAETRATIRQQGFNWRCWLRPEAAGYALRRLLYYYHKTKTSVSMHGASAQSTFMKRLCQDAWS